ncbi:MAG: response regulator [Anaerolineae bacterium]|nr:response regulator [Anaerolineae bacterium]
MPTRSTLGTDQSQKASQPAIRQSSSPSASGVLADWQIAALQKLTAEEPLLVTDDHAMSRRYYRTLLTQTFGMKLLETWDPNEALRLCQTERVSLVISCIVKPLTIDGLKLVTNLRADPRTRDIPLLFITGATNTREIAFQAGASAFLTKPCHPNEILQEIWLLLRGRVL